MVSGLDKQGTLKSNIELACQESEKIPSDFGRGGKEGMATFVQIMQGMEVVFKENQALNKAWNHFLAPQKT